MSLEANKAVALRVNDIHNRRDVAACDEVFAENYVNHSAPAGANDREARKRMVAMYVESAPDLHVQADDVIAEGDRVVVRWTTTGTQRGAVDSPLGRIEPSGKQISVTGISIYRVENGKIAEEWSSWDRLGFLEQAGAIPGHF